MGGSLLLSRRWREEDEASLSNHSRGCGAISQLAHLETLETVITNDDCMHEMRHLKVGRRRRE